MLPLAPVLLAILGCTRIDVNHNAVLPVVGMDDLEVTLERGSFTWVGGARNATIDLDVWSWGAAANETRARYVEESNEWGFVYLDGTATVWGLSPSPRGGVDIAGFGPRPVDVDALLLDGVVELEDVTGDVVVTAEGVTATNVRGSADLYAWTLGIDAVVRPATGDAIVLHARRGDIRIGLPAGLDYDILASGSEITAHDLLYDEYAGGPDWFEARTGDQSITVRIVAERGSVEIYEVPS